MGLVRIMDRGGEDYREYKRALKTAKKSIETLWELTDDMEDEYGYTDRIGYNRHDDDDVEMRRGSRRMR